MKSIILSLFLCSLSFSIAGQGFDLLGIVDDQLIKINSSTNAIEVVGNLNPSPAQLVRFLTYVEEDCLFYGIMNSSINPILISIDIDLNFTVIGDLTIPGGPLYFSEGLSFNTTDNTLYASVSLNGSIASNDYFTETIVEVNRFTAVCSYKTEIIGNVASPDIDRMTFCDNILYFYDGDPGSNWGKFFELDFSTLGVTSQAVVLTTVAYLPVKDLECFNGNIYFSIGRDLSFLNTASNNITNVGNLFTASEFGGEEITGLSINPFPDLDLEDEITICNEDEYLLELEYLYESVTWNNGSTGSSILVFDSGIYWADVVYNNCTFKTDTIEVSFIFPIDISLGQDTTICDGGNIVFTIDEPNIDIIWSDGTMGSEIEVSEPGSYWAQYILEGCVFYTDTIIVAIFNSIYELGEDITLCEGESYVLSIEDAGTNISWNNGYFGNPIVITEPGLYWAEVLFQGCEFMTDTINVSQAVPVDFSIVGDTVVCKGDIILFSVSDPNVDVIWSDGSTGNEIKIGVPGTYWGQYTIDNCTYYSDTIDVNYLQPLDIFIGTHTTLCQGEMLLLTIDEPNIEVTWSDGSTGNNLIISEPGLYWAIYYIDGCLFTTDSILVQFIEMDFDIGSDITLCEGEIHIINLEGVGQIVNWNSGFSGDELIITESGLYWAEIIIDDCVFLTDTIEVSYIQEVEHDIISDTIICIGETIYYSVNDPNAEVIWSNGTIGNEIAIADAGYYWAQYIIDGCAFFTDTIYVEVVYDEYNIGSDTSFCEGESFTLTIAGVGQNVNWNNGYTGNQLIITEAGTYWAEIALTNCQFTTNSITVNIIPEVLTEIGSDTVLCDGEEITLSVQNPFLDYEWNTGELGNSIVVKEAGTYWISLVDYECPSQSDSVDVGFIEDPELIYNLDTLICDHEELVISHSTYDITWHNENGQDFTSIIENGYYWGSYQIENCLFYTDTIYAQFVDCTPCSYYIPNVISPNFDGINDEFKVVFSNSCNIEDIEMTLYDRWGNLVCNSNENVWDGLVNNKLVANGVYVYSIKMKVRMYNGVMQEIKVAGDVTILK